MDMVVVIFVFCCVVGLIWFVRVGLGLLVEEGKFVNLWNYDFKEDIWEYWFFRVEIFDLVFGYCIVFGFE